MNCVKAKELREAHPLDVNLDSVADRIEALEKQNTVMRLALQRIARWHGEFPNTGKTWDDGSPMSYAACYGSNGERDYMRQVALNAISGSESAAVSAGGRDEYTCIGKGGSYELLGGFSGAGTMRGHRGMVYRDMESGLMFCRTDEDFAERMELVQPVTNGTGGQS